MVFSSPTLEQHVAKRLRSYGLTLQTWRALLLGLIALVTWQSVVTQSHVHASTGGTHLVRDRVAPAPAQDRSDDPATCPICRELASSGDYLPPAPIIVHAVAPSLPAALVERPQPSIEQTRWLAWRSRAPPALYDL